jgi:hypothetical protein
VSKERLQQLINEENRRAKNPLLLYEGTPEQERFLKSRAKIRLLRGGNRAGKSVTGYLQLARIATGVDPRKRIANDRPLLIYIVAYDADTIGRVAHRLLFKPGAFRIIQDKATGKWRTFKSWTKEDAGREAESELAPPYIPQEFIVPDSMGWDNKKENVFSVVKLHIGKDHPMNGTEIRAYGSMAEPAMGDPVDFILIDEDLYNPAWAREMESRLADRKGELIWTAFPKMQNDEMMKISARAEEQKDRENPDVQEFILTQMDNLHIDRDELRKNMEGMTEEEQRARIFGEYSTDSVLMYPQFSKEIHGLPRYGNKESDLIELHCANGVPDGWTRYISVDPGFSTCAAIFAAVPPPDVGKFVVIYDELYIKNCSASILAREVKKKMGSHVFQSFIIDDHGSRVTQAGSGESIYLQYVRAFEAAGIKSIMTGSAFTRGSDNIAARTSTVREWLAERPALGPTLRFCLGACPNLVREFALYKRRIGAGKLAVDQPIAANNHAQDALAYLAASAPYYVPPRPLEVPNPSHELYLKLFGEELNQKAITLGPAASSLPR